MATTQIPESIREELVASSASLAKGKAPAEQLETGSEMKIVYNNLGAESPAEIPVTMTSEGIKAYSGDYWGTFSLEKFASASSLTYTHEDAWGWLNYLKKFQPENFRYLDQNVRIWAYKEQYDNWQDTYGMDAVMAVYHSGHGGMTSSGKFYAPLGSDWGGQGTTIYSDQMRLGNEQVRYIFWSTCYSLRVLHGHNPIRTWDPANLGFRMLFGYETVSYDNPDYGSAFWKHWNKGKSFSKAFMDASWYDISTRQAPSVVACGATQNEAKNRVYNERLFYWGSVSKNWWWWRWYNAASATTAIRATNQELPNELLVAQFDKVNVSGRLVQSIMRKHDVAIAMPNEVTASENGTFYLQEGDRRISMEGDGSYEIQFCAPNLENLEQIAPEKAVSLGWDFLRQHGLNTDELMLDSVLLSSEGGGSQDGSGVLEGPFVTETILQFTQAINGLPVLLPNKGSVSVTVDNDGAVTSMSNSIKPILTMSEKSKGTFMGPDEPNPLDQGIDPKVLLADVWQNQLKETLIRGRMPLSYREVPGSFEIGYHVDGDIASLVARNDIEVDCGGGYYKRYSIKAPLIR